MENLRFKIGDLVWWARFDSKEACLECPDCAGTGRLRVIMGDDTIVSIECEGCRRGYQPATGYLKIYERTARAQTAIVTGAEIDGDKVEWRLSESYRVSDDCLFDNEQDCLARAQQLAAEYDQRERDQISKKEKPTRSWGWNARIKEAERQIEYHTKKLSVASIKAKEDKAAKEPQS